MKYAPNVVHYFPDFSCGSRPRPAWADAVPRGSVRDSITMPNGSCSASLARPAHCASSASLTASTLTSARVTSCVRSTDIRVLMPGSEGLPEASGLGGSYAGTDKRHNASDFKSFDGSYTKRSYKSNRGSGGSRVLLNTISANFIIMFVNFRE